jgi:hypothetical protein
VTINPPCIVDSKGMQIELRLHLVERFEIGVAQRHPYEAVRLTDVPVYLVGGDVGHLPARRGRRSAGCNPECLFRLRVLSIGAGHFL